MEQKKDSEIISFSIGKIEYKPNKKSELKCDLRKALRKLIKEVIKASEMELIIGGDDMPMIVNLLKLLEIYNTGQFYGTVAIKIVGVSPRNLRVQEQTFKLQEEKGDFFLDNI